MSTRGRAPPPPPPPRSTTADHHGRHNVPAPPPPTMNNSHTMTERSPLARLSTIPVQPAYHSMDVEIPEPPLTEAGRWTFHSQKEFPPPPPFEKKLKRYPSGAETGCGMVQQRTCKKNKQHQN
ncbi:hypothetical protein EC973_003567 [Apophysomyces ossiformis]|uniref:Uncharacterized protein n=1 Tax=Apophysomyces ossiformis TaxID=679940 RepID=A0A8H7EL19_9FUNG|nr:hypothetical protein EC973_003567 [Apophysomyces ossiformis]